MPTEALLTRGVQSAVAIGAGATNDVDVQCVGDSTLMVQTQMTGGAVGDLTVDVAPYEADNATVSGARLQPDAAGGPTFAGGKVTHWARYSVLGVDKVRVRITNNNAGAQTIDRSSWRLQ